MKFDMSERSVGFEFIYGDYTINIADYTTRHRPLMGFDEPKPEGKISVLIQKHGRTLSNESVQLIGTYVNNRIVGNLSVTVGIINIGIRQHDQFMYHLMKGIDLIIPR